ncbi:MAG TPA: hypothetical protein VJ779_10755 [Acetobacteraceae bacterium]|nr:hypothetical protein [Acetobacteraceae bacterium]
MKSALFALAALLGVAIGAASLSPASAVVSTAPYSNNSGGGAG